MSKLWGSLQNDLYSLVVEDIEGNICDDLIHLSEKGIEVCAKQVAKVIQDNLIEL